MSTMKLIVGLGNPGRQYKNTRHNIGFMSVERIAQFFNVDIKRRKFNCCYGISSSQQEEVVFIKPQTFMNLSGNAVRHFATYYKLSYENDILIIVDDVHLSFGALRMRLQGSSGGHNGIQSIIDATGSKKFHRLRIGVGKPSHGMDLTPYVLGKFSQKEREVIPEILTQAKEMSITWLQGECA